MGTTHTTAMCSTSVSEAREKRIENFSQCLLQSSKIAVTISRLTDGCFVESSLRRIFLKFSLLLDGGDGFWRGRPQRCVPFSSHQGYMFSTGLLTDVSHLAGAVFVRFLPPSMLYTLEGNHCAQPSWCSTSLRAECVDKSSRGRPVYSLPFLSLLSHIESSPSWLLCPFHRLSSFCFFEHFLHLWH